MAQKKRNMAYHELSKLADRWTLGPRTPMRSTAEGESRLRKVETAHEPRSFAANSDVRQDLIINVLSIINIGSRALFACRANKSVQSSIQFQSTLV